MDNNNLKVIREYWNVSAAQMSRICGFGINQWREYESGASIPNKSNSLILILAKDPYNFRRLLDQLPEEEKLAMGSRYKKLVKNAEQACNLIDRKVEEYRNAVSSDWIN